MTLQSFEKSNPTTTARQLNYFKIRLGIISLQKGSKGSSTPPPLPTVNTNGKNLNNKHGTQPAYSKCFFQ